MLYVYDESLPNITDDEICFTLKQCGETLDLSNVYIITVTALTEEYYGTISGVVDHDDDQEYIIWIDPFLDKEDTIRTLIHETVHVSQIARGDLELLSPMRWKGKVYECEYDQLPWEKEAYEIETKLYGKISIF